MLGDPVRRGSACLLGDRNIPNEPVENSSPNFSYDQSASENTYKTICKMLCGDGMAAGAVRADAEVAQENLGWNEQSAGFTMDLPFHFLYHRCQNLINHLILHYLINATGVLHG